MKHILAVDDEEGVRESLKAILSGKYNFSAVESVDAAIRVLSSTKVDLVVLDITMPIKSGFDLLSEIDRYYPDISVVMLSASRGVPAVVQAMRGGACDFLTKPFEVDVILHTVAKALERTVKARRLKVLESEMASEFPVDEIVGRAPIFLKALDDIRKIADTDSTLLVSGESGTGKELAARLLHIKSDRRDEPFIAVHCGALPESLIESELFGYEKGAFTSAENRKPGYFDLAGSGTLFLDELGEMPVSTQVKLLRVLQEREFMRIGGTRIIKTNARIVAASAEDLRTLVNRGKFREDLFYRISVVPVRLPALRERKEDIPLLARHFLKLFREKLNAAAEDFSSDAMELLCNHNWPGNVRDAMSKSYGVQTKAAELLGISRRKLGYRLKKFGINAGEFGDAT